MPDFGNTVADKIPSKPSDPAKTTVLTNEKAPFPWPIALAILMPAMIYGLVQNQLQDKNYTMGMRILWDSICSIVPGVSMMILVGSVAQFKKRPFLSAISIFLSILFVAISYWGIQRFLENRWLN